MLRIFYLCSIFVLFSGQSLPEMEGMIFIEGGFFEMGNLQEHQYFYQSEKPVHKVLLEDFYIGKYETTNKEYVEFLNSRVGQFIIDSIDRADKSSLGIRYEKDIYVDVKFEPDTTLQLGINIFNQEGRTEFRVVKGFGNWPVTFVTWYGAKAYCQWKFDKGDLPSESQWEYVARNGKYWNHFDFKFSGGNDLDSLGWYWDNADFKVHEVGQKAPNKLGVYDLSGNLWEWIDDHWHENYNNAPDDGSSWVDNDLKKDHNRVLRGGAWLYSKEQSTTTNRWNDVPDDRHDYKGFRCVCEK